MSSFNNWLIQLGSGSVQTSGYVGQGVYFNPATSAVSLSSGFNIANQQAAQFHSGNFVLNLVDTNKWTGSGLRHYMAELTSAWLHSGWRW
jgi:hypothetical protein